MADNSAVLDVFGDVSSQCRDLSARDSVLQLALQQIGVPHIRRRKGGFPGLFWIIVGQQVSVPSAQAIWKRCIAGVKPMSPKTVLALGEAGIRDLGLTRQKAHYIVCLAESIRTRQISFKDIAQMSDDTASCHLQTIKGIGPWSAGIYLLFCEGRANIWPPGDIALEHAYAAAAGLPSKPSSSTLNEIAEQWHPWRGLAAHILWTYYAHIKGRKPI